MSPEHLTNDVSIADLGAGSLDIVELVMEIEEMFDNLNLVIPSDEKENCKTVGDIVRLILKYVDQQ